MAIETLPKTLAGQLRELDGRIAEVLQWIENRERILVDMRALGEQIDALYRQYAGLTMSEIELAKLRTRQDEIQAQIEKRREEADAALRACGSFFEAVEAALWEAARHDAEFLAPARAFQALAPGRSGEPKRLLAEALETRELLQKLLAPKGHSAQALPVTETASPAPAVNRTPGLWTVRQAAERLGLSEKTVYRMARLGQMPHTRVGRSLRFRPEDVEAWIARQSLVPRRR